MLESSLATAHATIKTLQAQMPDGSGQQDTLVKQVFYITSLLSPQFVRNGVVPFDSSGNVGLIMLTPVLWRRMMPPVYTMNKITMLFFSNTSSLCLFNTCHMRCHSSSRLMTV